MWHPRGILDDAFVDEITDFTQTLENLSGAPFDRFIDLSGLSEIRLQMDHVFEIAKERRSDTADLPPVKSAFYCNTLVGFGIARMYEALMEGASISVRAFRDKDAAAAFLGMPSHLLDQTDDPAAKRHT
jgi:hypothetical protein